MKKFVCLLTMFLMISLTMSAQASGGQITRKKTNTTTTQPHNSDKKTQNAQSRLSQQRRAAQLQAERERIASLNLTKADFWIALLDGGITKAMVKEKIGLIPDETLKAKTLIRLDEADHFWRGDASMDIIGGMFGLTPEDLTYLFENKELPIKEEEPALDNLEESEGL